MNKISEKLKAVATAVAAIEKQFGRGAVMQLGGDAVEQKVPVIPSGSVGLDKAFGIGGYPRGRVVEIFGNESSGKTTLALHAIAQVQAEGYRDVIVAPIGFLCDHVEVLYDLDLQARDTAVAYGLTYVRAATVGTHPAFLTMLSELLAERLHGG